MSEGRGAGPSAPVSSRIPPHNIDAEASVLGAMLLSRDAIADAIEVVTAEHFYKPAHVHIFEAITSLYSAGEPADPVTVAEELTRAGVLERIGGPAALVTLQANTPATSSAATYARIVLETAMLRRMIGVANDIAEIGYSRPDDVEKAIDHAESLMYQVAEGRAVDTLAPISDLLDQNLDRLEQLYERGESLTGTPSGYADLDDLLSGLQPNALIVVGARPAMGKALATDTPIPTPTGWTTMGELRVGDRVFDETGQPCSVTYVSPVRIDRDCYRVVFDDGCEIVADADHQWFTYDEPAWKSYRALWSRLSDPAPRRLSLARDQSSKMRRPAVRTTVELHRTLRAPDGRPNHRIPVTAPLELPETDLPLDPYAFGVWLGDGNSDGPVITTADREIEAQLVASGLTLVPTGQPCGRATQYRLLWTASSFDVAVDRCRRAVEAGSCVRHAAEAFGLVAESMSQRARREGWERACPARPCPFRFGRTSEATRSPFGTVKTALRELGVLKDKHIPALYQRASVKQRLALLQGIMDTDGYVTNANGSVELCLSNRRLLEDVRELVCSLGHDPGPIRHRRTNRSTDAWRFSWTAPEVVFRLERKAEKQRVVDRPTASTRWRRIVDIRRTVSVPVQCITVDAPRSLYLAGRSMIPTHNTAFALGMAAHAAVEHQRPVLLFSLEMSQLEISQRILCSEARVDSKHVRDGKLTESDWAKISNGVGRLAEAPLWIDDNPNLTLMEIRAKARRLKSRTGDLGMVIVDYLQLMTGRAGAESRQVEVAELSRGLKILARELQVPVVALSQLSRTLESRQDKRPMLADLRESGSIEQDADVVMFIYRDEVYNPETSDVGTAEILVAKHRNGPTGVIRLAFLPHYTRFANMARVS